MEKETKNNEKKNENKRITKVVEDQNEKNEKKLMANESSVKTIKKNIKSK